MDKTPTAEERAAAVYQKLWECVYLKDDSIPIIAQAIREAETAAEQRGAEKERAKLEPVIDAVDNLINNWLINLDCPWCLSSLGSPVEEPEEHRPINGEPCPLGKLIDEYGKLP